MMVILLAWMAHRFVSSCGHSEQSRGQLGRARVPAGAPRGGRGNTHQQPHDHGLGRLLYGQEGLRRPPQVFWRHVQGDLADQPRERELPDEQVGAPLVPADFPQRHRPRAVPDPLAPGRGVRLLRGATGAPRPVTKGAARGGSRPPPVPWAGPAGVVRGECVAVALTPSGSPWPSASS